MGEGRGTYRVLVRKPEVKRRLGRPRLRWVDSGDSIKMDPHGVGSGNVLVSTGSGYRQMAGSCE
jgi:hypothetical protein